MMIIIMMVIKRKNLTMNVTLLPRTLTLLNSCTPSPWHWTEECWHLLWVLAQGSAPHGVRTSDAPGQMPLLQQEADAPSDSICTFSPQ